jgi:hypothetical protein
VPDELGDFKNLYHLTLIENFLQGPLPMKQMAKLTNLWDVDLGTNRFTGTIPTGFGAQGQLSGFNLNDNKVSEKNSTPAIIDFCHPSCVACS